MSVGRPRVTLHFAQSLDGRIGFASGRRRAVLSAPEGIERAHRARAEHDAVLVGIRTVLSDDPLLTVRACNGPQPRRVVLDSTLRLPDEARVLARGHGGDGGGEVIVLGAHGRALDPDRRRLQALGATVQVLPATERGWVSLPAALAWLFERGVARLLVEGGAAVLTSFLRERLADFAAVDVAPCLLGGPAIPALGDLGDHLGDRGDRAIAESVRLERMRVERAGDNLFVTGPLVYGGGGDESRS